jgi:redox-sensitive bicupin YhaK (pirin superfamily)
LAVEPFADIQLDTDLTVVGSGHFFRVGEAQFGVRGLIAIESVGPYVPVQHMGPMLMIHDGYFQPGFGIGHHPHRTNERLFYILSGRVEHDDALNHIRGTMEEGDLGRLTEGVRGMFHQEWNGAEHVTRAFILVYHPDAHPPIPVAEFGLLKAADRVPITEGPGAETLELFGPSSEFRVNHTGLHRYTDTSLDPGAGFEVALAPNRGLLLYPVDGQIRVSRTGAEDVVLDAEESVHPEGPGNLAVAWSDGTERRLRLEAVDTAARLLRVEFERSSDDLVLGDPYLTQ